MELLNVEHVFEDPDDLSVIDQIKAIVQQEADDLKRNTMKICADITN